MKTNSQGFTDTHNNQKDFGEANHAKDTGPYIGTVKTVTDPLRMGRLGVNIPALTNTTRPKASQIIWCQYLSPFYGAKSISAVSKTDPYSYKESQHSYGMWAIPPDIDTEVLVIFAKGDRTSNTAFWIGCVQKPLVNQQVPANGSTRNTVLGAGGVDFSQDKRQVYANDLLPAGEKNQLDYARAEKLDTVGSWKHPVNDILADQLVKQGLVKDNVRGTTTSSARRESPSAVFGMNTPGRIRADSRVLNIGLEGSPVTTDRSPGHSFVMDDGDVSGNNQLTRLRTASGHQILMHDTDGSIYIANASGNAWIEMQSNGRIDLYSGIGGINFRTEGDMNFHSDLNMNFHANKQVRMSSASEIINSADLILNIGDKGILSASQKGSIREYARDGITSFTSGTQLHGAGGQFHLAGAQVHFNSTGASPAWGPSWLTKEKAGMQLRTEGDVELAGKPQGTVLEPFTRKGGTKTAVHRLVTHEPMFRASVIGSDGVFPIDSDDKKLWSTQSRIPGTAEFLNQQNRFSENTAIRDAQYQADALAYVKTKMGKSTDGAKAKKLLADFGTTYNDIYGISNSNNLPFNIEDSISEKIKGIDLFSTDSKDLTSNLTSQVIENFTGKSTSLFKDNVFVNTSGELFSLGGTSLGGTGNIDLGNKDLNSLVGLTKNLSAGSNIISGTSSISNLSSVTQTFSSVVGGKVVGMNQVKSLASKTGLFNAREAAISGQTFFQNVGANLVSNIGSIAGKVTSFFSSGGFFSDVRLKEDVRFIGRSPAGVNVYSFKYKQLPGRYIGVMAQEVPWARHMTDTGYYAVDYSKVDVEFRRLH